MGTRWNPESGKRRIIHHLMDDTMMEFNHNTLDMMNTTVKVVGAFAEQEVLGLFSVTGEHTQHVDHGWIVRYVLKVNGIKLAEKWIKSDQYGNHGAPLADGTANIGPCRMTIHKSAAKHGITKPEIGVGDG